MTIELKKWLNTPCSNEDLVELKDQVFYMPIGVVKRKIQYMEDTFKVSVFETNFHHFLFNQSQKEAIASGSIEIKIVIIGGAFDGCCFVQLVGTATFPISYYGENTHYAATLESLCIVNAFGGKYPQFGSGLNKFDVVSPKAKGLAEVPAKEMDAVINKLFKQLKTKLSKYSNREEAQAYLETTEFRFNIEAKEIVNSLPLKNK